ncbi:hypothetical protein HZA43_01845 [Candidatus Peregrinibacteria bacterium]|nr:hypothetical protein [Candidatus Peregrinibacteria bacterium]
MKRSLLVTRLLSLEGFSLIELMFAMVFLALIVFGVIKLQTSNLMLSNTTEKESDAYFWANQGIEIAEGLGYAAIQPVCAHSPCTKYLSSAPYNLADTQEPLIGGVFRRLILADGTGLTSAYKVTSRVEWTDNTGPHSVDVKRIILIEN